MKYAKVAVLIIALACLAVPLIGWLIDPTQNQWEVFNQTWFFPVYGAIVVIVGSTISEMLK